MKNRIKYSGIFLGILALLVLTAAASYRAGKQSVDDDFFFSVECPSVGMESEEKGRGFVCIHTAGANGDVKWWVIQPIDRPEMIAQAEKTHCGSLTANATLKERIEMSSMLKQEGKPGSTLVLCDVWDIERETGN